MGGSSHPLHTPTVWLLHTMYSIISVLLLQKVASRVTGNHSSCNNQKIQGWMYAQVYYFSTILFLWSVSVGLPQNVLVLSEQRGSLPHGKQHVSHRRMFSVSLLTSVMSRDTFQELEGIQTRISISCMGKISPADFPCWNHWSFSCHVLSVACQGLRSNGRQ